MFFCFFFFFFFQAEDGIRDAQESRGLGDVYKRQAPAMRDFYKISAINSGGKADEFYYSAANYVDLEEVPEGYWVWSSSSRDKEFGYGFYQSTGTIVHLSLIHI